MALLRPLSLIAAATLAALFAIQDRADRPVAASKSAPRGDVASGRRPPRLSVLSDVEWRRIDAAIDRGLAWLATQQAEDGSFATRDSGQPGVTSLCVMAYLSRGHLPGQGPYGKAIERAIDFVLSCQRDDGLLSYMEPTMSSSAWLQPTHAAAYNHNISGLMLGEVYGQTSGERNQRIQPAIVKALALARDLQVRPKGHAVDAGGVRYYRVIPQAERQGGDGDVSVTGWYIMFLRSAKNAGFDVPQNFVDEALDFVRRCYDAQTGGFHYSLVPPRIYYTRGATGAGVLSLFLSGRDDVEIERNSGKWILANPFTPYGNAINSSDHYLYAAYYCSQAMFQLGGEYWDRFYPEISATLLANQNAEGSWTPESRDLPFGNAYGTALVVLTLTPPYQLLPIYQR